MGKKDNLTSDKSYKNMKIQEEIIESGELINLKEKGEKGHKSVLSRNLILIICSTMILLACVNAFLIYHFTLDAVLNAKEQELSNLSAFVSENINLQYPGDYLLEGDSSYRLYKGDTDITQKYELMENASELTGLEYSLIYHDTRILTTIQNSDGYYIIGTGLAEQIFERLTSSSEGLFYKNTLINNDAYFSYYYPIYNEDGSLAGAIECCSPRSSIIAPVITATIASTLIILLATVVLIILIYRYNKGITRSIEKLLSFTKDATSGNDAALIDANLLRRKDEFGTIATSVLDMHRAMRDSMDKDPLTKLYNRRSANRKFDIIRSHYEKDGTPYSIAIGDIDYFKKVNDTYGHDAGDAVLQAVASILQDNMKNIGFAARWGGEEFLLAFDRIGIDEATKHLEKILNEIRELVVENDGQEIRLTMSFGVTCNPDLSKDEIINEADEHLYHAKESGRNRIVNN